MSQSAFHSGDSRLAHGPGGNQRHEYGGPMPPMPPRNRTFFAVLMLVLLAIPAVALFTELSRRSDIWWTPPTMLVPLTDGADRVLVNVRGKPLGELLNGGKL